MSALANEVRVRPVFVRSVNLERDTPQPPLDGYVPTARALATIERLTSAMAAQGGGRAWSITGPYGSGKSHFAAFLDALCGPPERNRTRAEALLAKADPALHERFRAARKAFGADYGLVRAVATAQREPVATTLVRALRTGAERRWGNKLPRGLTGALQAAGRDPRARELSALVSRMAAHTPVLLVVDEFGKNLEYLAEDAAGGDLFVLQELAELAARADTPVLFLTLQHLAFADYAASANLDVARRREWAKVQGRFEDVAFVDSTAQAARIIASTLDKTGASRSFERRVRGWAAAGFEALAGIGLVPSPVEGPDVLASCYPLHPLTTVALPELCARFGQHERTLIGFLASSEPGTVASFLAETELPRKGLPTVDLDAAYDYFVGAAATMIASAPDAGRWLEIEARLRDVQGVGAQELRLLKTIAVLNLVSAGGSLRASAPVLALALDDRTEALAVRLAELERRGLVTYRDFAGEYRIWQGSDFDIRGHLDDARARMRQRPIAELLTEVVPPAAVVAARHSQRVGMLRFFEAAYRSPDASFDVPPGADGLLAYVVGAGAFSAAVLPLSSDPRPVVVAAIDEPAQLTAAAVEAAAHLDVLRSAEALTGDWVARRELQERVALAVDAVRARLAEAFAPGSPQVHWRSPGGAELAAGGGVSRLLSAVCDEVYPQSPEIRSEMLGRRELTSQGAKARRELLVAMVGRGSQEQLGIEGYGPERAMYEAVLRHPGIHRYDKAEEAWAFSPPLVNSSLAPVWRALDELVLSAVDHALGVDELYSLLAAPPFGLKEGPIPVLVAAVLLHRHDEVAIYQDGTYQPQLTADLLERLVKAPERFALKSFEAAGARRALLGALGESLGVATLGRRRRNPSVVRVAAPLLGALRGLPDYALHTTSLSSDTVAVRAALLDARQPDELLFTALPEACGVAAYPAGAKSVPADLDVFLDRLAAAVDELRQAYPRLIEDSATTLAEALYLPIEMSELRADLRARARRLDGQVLDPRLRSFLFIAMDSELDDEQWLEAVLLNVSKTPTRAWRDDDVRRFEIGLVTLAGLFRRVESLHFETLARQGLGFDARQVTITAPDGKETTALFSVDHEVHPHIATVAEDAAARARDMAGPAGLSALIAVLAGMASRSEQTDGRPARIVEEEVAADG
ncbi:MAG: hypothetical protein ABR540_14335 [Acidimicrobiales bacterium]